MDLFRAAFKCFTEEHLSSDDNESSDSNICPHNEIHTDDKKKVCMDCGEILSEGYLIVQPGNNMQRRKRNESSLYRDIPFFISSKTKEMTLEIYRTVTGTEMFRNTFKRAILFACLHRASIICGEGMCFDDIMDLMNLKTHEAGKGVNYVTTHIDKNSIYIIPLFTDEVSISAIISSLGINIDPDIVKQLFQIIKYHSDILNNSHYKSVVCGCIFFWMKMNNIPMTIKQFVKKINMTELTIVKKYTAISTVILKMVLKELYTFVLTKTPKKRSRKIKAKRISAPKENTLYLSKDKLTINNYKSKDDIVVTTHGGNTLPLDDVDDITEWNMLLNNVYYDHKGNTISPGLVVVQTTKDLYINFTCFDGATGLNGKEVLRSLIIQRCNQMA
jgi:transcription initiation factor TFIIIB Brf1 subunit/transcription initiation factor TFIIB